MLSTAFLQSIPIQLVRDKHCRTVWASTSDLFCVIFCDQYFDGQFSLSYNLMWAHHRARVVACVTIWVDCFLQSHGHDAELSAGVWSFFNFRVRKIPHLECSVDIPQSALYPLKILVNCHVGHYSLLWVLLPSFRSGIVFTGVSRSF